MTNVLKQMNPTGIREEIQNAMKEIGPQIVTAIKEGLNQIETKDSPLATQTLINEAETIRLKMAEKSNQPDTNESPEILFNIDQNNEDPPTRNIPNIYSMITKEELCKTVNELIDQVNELKKQIKQIKFIKHQKNQKNKNQNTYLLLT